MVEAQLNGRRPEWVENGLALSKTERLVLRLMASSTQLRNVQIADIPIFYAHHLQLHPHPDTASHDTLAGEEACFFDRWKRTLGDESVLVQTILWQGSVAGYVAHFVQLDKPAISYWLDRETWGQGVATQAIEAFLPLVRPRPLYARVAWDNHASLRVLEKVGFVVVGKDTFFSTIHRAEVDEIVLGLE